MSRTVSYKCDRCRDPVAPKSVVRIAVNIQEGGRDARKKSLDFCPECFAVLSAAYESAMRAVPEHPDPVPAEAAPAQERAPATDSCSGIGQEACQEQPPAAAQDPGKAHGQAQAPHQSEAPDESVDAAASADAVPRADDLVLGPISDDERMEILRLHAVEGLPADEIAKRMRRLPKGVKRAINSAEKSGELARIRDSFQGAEPGRGPEGPATERAIQETASSAAETDPDEEEDGPESTGVSNARVGRSSYVAPPLVDRIGGKKYDTGCILALARAGWPAEEIAKERNYDLAVVKHLMKQNGLE